MSKPYIVDVLHIIKKQQSEEYRQAYREAISMTTEELYRYLIHQKMKYYTNGQYHFNQLATCGCSYQRRDNELVGCSMCNLHDDSYQVYAYMAALRHRDQTLYTSLIRNIVLKSRGRITSRHIHEFIFAHNFLNTEEVPDELLIDLLANKTMYEKKPAIYEFETRVDTITPETLDKLKTYIGHRNIWLRVGVETANETIRNSWLNKNLYNDQMRQAVKLCHSYGYKLSANILMGLPGVTEELSLLDLCGTVQWLLEIGVDTIVCSVLSRKPYTIQQYIYDHLRGNKELSQYALTGDEHTGLPWLYTILRFLQWAADRPSIRKFLTFGQFNSSYIQGNVTYAYNAQPQCRCSEYIRGCLAQLSVERDWGIVEKVSGLCQNDSCVEKYKQLLKKQSAITSIKQNLLLVEKELSMFIWEDCWWPHHQAFKQELNNME